MKYVKGIGDALKAWKQTSSIGFHLKQNFFNIRTFHTIASHGDLFDQICHYNFNSD